MILSGGFLSEDVSSGNACLYNEFSQYLVIETGIVMLKND